MAGNVRHNCGNCCWLVSERHYRCVSLGYIYFMIFANTIPPGMVNIAVLVMKAISYKTEYTFVS